MHSPSTICSQTRTFYDIDSIQQHLKKFLYCSFKLNLMLIISDTFTIIYVLYSTLCDETFQCWRCSLTLIWMAIKKCIAVPLGVLYGSQATNRKQGGLPVRAAFPRRTPIGHLGVMYDSQPAEIHKNTTINRWQALVFYILENRLIQHFFKENLLQDIILIHFVRNRSRITNIFTSDHFELYLFNVSKVAYATSHPD